MKLFDKVRCKGFYAKFNDGKCIFLDTNNLSADFMCGEDIIEDDDERIEKTYFRHKEMNFSGIIVGFTDLTISAWLEAVWQDAVDVGIGVIPEKYFVHKTVKDRVKCAVVYYANNKKHYVPLNDIVEVLKEGDNRNEDT